MKTSQITKEYGTVFMIANSGQTSLQGWNHCLSTSLYLPQCRECAFFLELKSGLENEKWVTRDIICN